MLRVHVQRGEAPASVYVFEDRSIVVGRGEGADLRLPFADVSRRQCRLVAAPGGVAIEELSTSGGTFVDGVRVRGRVTLAGASRVRFGGSTMWVRVEGDAGEGAARAGRARGGEPRGREPGSGGAAATAVEGAGGREVEGRLGGEAVVETRREAEGEWLADVAERWCERGRPAGLLLDRRRWSRARAVLGEARALHPDDPRVALVEASGRALRERRRSRGIVAAIVAAAVFAGVAAGGGFEDPWPEVEARVSTSACAVGPGRSAVDSLRALEEGIARGCRTERAEAAMWAAMAGHDAVWIGRAPGSVAAIEAAPEGRGAVVEAGGDAREGMGGAMPATRWWIDEAAVGLVALDGDVASAARSGRGGEEGVVARSDAGGWRALAVAGVVAVRAGERVIARWPAPGDGSVAALEIAEDGTTLAAVAGRWHLRRLGDRRWRGLGEGASALCGAGCAVVGGPGGELSRVTWEGRRWRERRLTSMAAPVVGVRRAGDDAVVAVGADGAIAWVSLTASWRREGEAVRIDLRQGGGDAIRAWAVSRAGRALAAVDAAGRVDVWAIGDAGARRVDLGSRESAAGALHRAAEQSVGATAVAFVGDVLVIGDARGDVWRRWMGEGEDGAGGVAHGAALRAIALAGNGRGASVDSEGMIRMWRVGAEGEARVDGGVASGAVVRALAIDGEGRRVAAAIGERVWVWEEGDPGGGAVEVRSAGPSVTRIAFAGRWLVAGDEEGEIVGWEVEAAGVAKEGRPVGRHPGGITALAAVGEVVASGDAEGRVRLWRLGPPGEPTEALGRGAAVAALVIEGGRMVASREDGEVWIVGGAGAERVVPAGEGPRAIAVAPGGALVAIAGGAGEVWLWREGEQMSRLASGGAGEVVGLAFASEERLVAVDAAGEVWLGSVVGAGEEVAIGRLGVVGAGREVVIAVNRGVVAIGDREGRVRLWPATPEGAVVAGCRRLGGGCR